MSTILQDHLRCLNPDCTFQTPCPVSRAGVCHRRRSVTSGLLHSGNWMFIQCISRGVIYGPKPSSKHGMSFCQLNIQDMQNWVTSYNMCRWRHEYHSLKVYHEVGQNCEAAEVQEGATARREQCGRTAHNVPHLNLNRSLWKGNGTTVHEHITTNNQRHASLYICV